MSHVNAFSSVVKAGQACVNDLTNGNCICLLPWSRHCSILLIMFITASCISHTLSVVLFPKPADFVVGLTALLQWQATWSSGMLVMPMRPSSSCLVHKKQTA